MSTKTGVSSFSVITVGWLFASNRRGGAGNDILIGDTQANVPDTVDGGAGVDVAVVNHGVRLAATDPYMNAVELTVALRTAPNDVPLAVYLPDGTGGVSPQSAAGSYGNWTDADAAALGTALFRVNRALPLHALLEYRAEPLTLFRTTTLADSHVTAAVTDAMMGRYTQLRDGEARYQIPDRTYAVTDAAFAGKLDETLIRMLFTQAYDRAAGGNVAAGWMRQFGWAGSGYLAPSATRTASPDGQWTYPTGAAFADPAGRDGPRQDFAATAVAYYRHKSGQLLSIQAAPLAARFAYLDGVLAAL